MRNHSHTLVDSQEEWRNIWKSLLWIQKLYHELFVWCESGTVVFSKDAAHLNFRELTGKSLHIFLLANYISNCIWIFVCVCQFWLMTSRWNLHAKYKKKYKKNKKKQELARGSNPRPYKTTLYNKGLWSQKGGMLVGHDSKSQKGVVLYRLTC